LNKSASWCEAEYDLDHHSRPKNSVSWGQVARVQTLGPKILVHYLVDSLWDLAGSLMYSRVAIISCACTANHPLHQYRPFVDQLVEIRRIVSQKKTA
jgi:hypothetical protein